MEESEHKAVAFDTFRHVGGSERVRRLAMTAVHLDFLFELVVMTAVSLALDSEARRRPVRTLRSAVRLIRSPFASGKAIRQLLQYYQRGFRPNDRDTSDLVATWRRQLFNGSDAETVSPQHDGPDDGG